jgi:hypothetical protein
MWGPSSAHTHTDPQDTHLPFLKKHDQEALGNTHSVWSVSLTPLPSSGVPRDPICTHKGGMTSLLMYSGTVQQPSYPEIRAGGFPCGSCLKFLAFHCSAWSISPHYMDQDTDFQHLNPPPHSTCARQTYHCPPTVSILSFVFLYFFLLLSTSSCKEGPDLSTCGL